jgi:hypothetical protein
MHAAEIRPFRRSDRDQLTSLVNAHASAVIPGASAAVHAVLSQLEREPGEFITDPWVSQRATLVAEQNRRLVAAAHLLRYVPDERAGTCYRGLGEICWFLFWPHAAAGNPSWPDASPAGDQLMSACLRLLRQWGAARQAASGDLARVGDLPRPGATALAGMTVRRSVGLNGTRLAAVRDDAEIGYIEVEAGYDQERRPRLGGWAEVGGLSVEPTFRRQGVATWLLGQAGNGWGWPGRPDPGLRLAGRHGPWRPGLRGLPGVPPDRRIPGARPDQTGLDPQPSEHARSQGARS